MSPPSAVLAFFHRQSFHFDTGPHQSPAPHGIWRRFLTSATATRRRFSSRSATGRALRSTSRRTPKSRCSRRAKQGATDSGRRAWPSAAAVGSRSPRSRKSTSLSGRRLPVLLARRPPSLDNTKPISPACRISLRPAELRRRRSWRRQGRSSGMEARRRSSGSISSSSSGFSSSSSTTSAPGRRAEP